MSTFISCRKIFEPKKGRFVYKGAPEKGPDRAKTGPAKSTDTKPPEGVTKEEMDAITDSVLKYAKAHKGTEIADYFLTALEALKSKEAEEKETAAAFLKLALGLTDSPVKVEPKKGEKKTPEAANEAAEEAAKDAKVDRKIEDARLQEIERQMQDVRDKYETMPYGDFSKFANNPDLLIKTVLHEYENIAAKYPMGYIQKNIRMSKSGFAIKFEDGQVSVMLHDFNNSMDEPGYKDGNDALIYAKDLIKMHTMAHDMDTSYSTLALNVKKGEVSSDNFAKSVDDMIKKNLTYIEGQFGVNKKAPNATLPITLNEKEFKLYYVQGKLNSITGDYVGLFNYIKANEVKAEQKPTAEKGTNERLKEESNNTLKNFGTKITNSADFQNLQREIIKGTLNLDDFKNKIHGIFNDQRFGAGLSEGEAYMSISGKRFVLNISAGLIQVEGDHQGLYDQMKTSTKSQTVDAHYLKEGEPGFLHLPLPPQLPGRPNPYSKPRSRGPM